MSWLLHMLELLLSSVLAYARQHPFETAIAVLAFVRLFGTTVQSGSKGVLFTFGRVRKELEPGFHLLFPIIQAVRKTPVRSVTLELPPQRLTTTDGLVFDVRVNLVYRVAEPKVALVQIADLRAGIEAVLPVIVQDMVRGRTRAELLERKGLDEELAMRAAAQLQRWGVAVEQAGFQSIAPTHRTLRLTQLAILATERCRVLEDYLRQGLAPHVAVALLGADRQCMAHSTARYRGALRRPPVAPAPARPAPATVPTEHDGRPQEGLSEQRKKLPPDHPAHVAPPPARVTSTRRRAARRAGRPLRG